MLLELAIGDAYGAGFEFCPVEKIAAYNDLTAYHVHDPRIPAGNYTDDTQMSLALAELLIDGVDWTRENIAQKFVECFKRDARFGYSREFYTFLTSVQNGEEFLKKMKTQSTRNGAAMRSAPMGYIKDIDRLLEMAQIQAVLTHNTEIGIKSSQAVALAAHYFIYDMGPKSELTQFVTHYTKSNWKDDWSRPVACCGEETVNALLTVIKEANALRDVLIRSVRFSGDVDTVAAIGFGIASLNDEFDRALPGFLYEDLENGTYGKPYLQKLDSRLSGLRNS